MNGIFANNVWTMYFEYFESCHFSRENTNIETYRYIRVYADLRMINLLIWMWIWLILKNISLLDRIWSLWRVRFVHSTTNFIFWLGRLIFSVSINSHPDNIYLLIIVKLKQAKLISSSYNFDVKYKLIRHSTYWGDSLSFSQRHRWCNG